LRFIDPYWKHSNFSEFRFMAIEFSSEQIGQWAKQLDDLAQQPGQSRSRRAAIEELIEPILQALQQHSYEEVAQCLTEGGLHIKPGSLKQYVCRYRRQHQLEPSDRPSSDRASHPTTPKSDLPTFNLETELSQIPSPAITESSQWAEPKFNRNRVRPNS
jgi:hypothetical protein